MKRQRQLLTVVILVIIAIMLATGCDGITPTNPSKTMAPHGIDANNNKTYRDVFNQNKVIEVSVSLKNEYYNEMMAAPEAEQFYSADVTIEGNTVYNSGFRTQGNTEFVGTSEASLEKYSYKLRFDKYVDKQKYLKLDELVLINCYKDPSYMREYLSYLAFEYLDSEVAPLAIFATLKINGKDMGLYLCVEAVEDAYLNRVVGNNDGNLYKASEGATLESNTSVSLLEQKNGKIETKEDITAFVNKLLAMPNGEKGDIESVLDVQSALKFIAVNTVVGNYDGYLGKNAKDYYLAYDGTRFFVAPWDMNETFGSGNKDNGVTATVNPYVPVYRVDMSQRPLVENLLAVPEYKSLYEGYITKLTEFLQKLPEEINKIHSLIEPYVKKDTQSFYGYDQYLVSIGKSQSENTSGYITLNEYISLRLSYLTSLNAQ